jgi:hypothetical protein
MGHTMSIHSKNEQVILEFGLKKPAFRIIVNSPTTLGSIGLTTGLDPAMTLGCGGYGGNITSDNISPKHLLNIKRLAYEVSPLESARSSGNAVSRPWSAQPRCRRVHRRRFHSSLSAKRTCVSRSAAAGSSWFPSGRSSLQLRGSLRKSTACSRLHHGAVDTRADT